MPKIRRLRQKDKLKDYLSLHTGRQTHSVSIKDFLIIIYLFKC